ncbi:MAG: N-acetyltransferase [Candidatus Micrarchaeia archaeon]
MSAAKHADTEIGRARIHDAEEISRLVEMYTKKARLLPRPLSEVYEHIRDFYVARVGEKPVGCCALHIYWKDLGEIRSLAVAPRWQRRGIGSALVRACLQEARRLRLKRVFALTLIPGFFERLGFRRVERNTLPMKIWSDCIRCPKFAECDEVAVVYEL